MRVVDYRLEGVENAEPIYRLGMEVASRKGDLMPLKEMEHRALLLSATHTDTTHAPASTGSHDRPAKGNDTCL